MYAVLSILANIVNVRVILFVYYAYTSIGTEILVILEAVKASSFLIIFLKREK